MTREGAPPDTRTPLVVVLAGPNGAGKSTSAEHLLRGALAVDEFVNADTIAQGLSAYRPESTAVTAGRVMLDRLRVLARSGRDFAFETTDESGVVIDTDRWNHLKASL